MNSSNKCNSIQHHAGETRDERTEYTPAQERTPKELMKCFIKHETGMPGVHYARSVRTLLVKMQMGCCEDCEDGITASRSETFTRMAKLTKECTIAIQHLMNMLFAGGVGRTGRGPS